MTTRSLGHRAPLLWLVLPLMAGSAVAHAFDLPHPGWQLAAAAVAALATFPAAAIRPRGWAAAIVVTLFFAGSASYTLRRRRLPDWENLPAREARFVMRIERVFPPADPRRAAAIGRITQAEGPVHALVEQRVYVSISLRGNEAPPLRSAHLLVRGLLEPVPRHPPPDSFPAYLDNAGVNFRLSRARVLATARPPTRYYVFLHHAADTLNGWLSLGVARKQPALTAIYHAMMLGEKNELSDEQNALFMHSGTMHLFAINGVHIGIVAASLHALFLVLRCPRPLAVAATLAILWLDVDTTGASPSAVRAFFLVASIEAAFLLRRPRNGLAALSTAALAILLLDPFALFSASFQMSYGVVTAILCLGLPLADWANARWAPFQQLPEASWTRTQRWIAAGARWCWPTLGIGVASSVVSALTGPAFFQVFAPGGFFANLTLVPLAMLVIVAGFSGIVASGGGLTAATGLFNHAAVLVLLVMDAMIRRGLRIPSMWWEAHWRLPWLAPLALATLVALLLAGYSLGWRRGLGGFWPPIGFVVLMLIFGIKLG